MLTSPGAQRKVKVVTEQHNMYVKNYLYRASSICKPPPDAEFLPVSVR